MGESAVADKESKEAKTEEKGEKKEKAPKEVKKVNVKSVKASSTTAIDPRTGTRFTPNSARQLAFEIVIKMAKEGKNVKEIRDVLAKTRKENGSAFNLDVGYLNYVVACHPEMLEVYTDGKVKVVAEPKIDAEAAKKFEEERESKKKKAEAARNERKEKAKGEKSEKSEKKEEKKAEKSDDKPSKKEKKD